MKTPIKLTTLIALFALTPLAIATHSLQQKASGLTPNFFLSINTVLSIPGNWAFIESNYPGNHIMENPISEQFQLDFSPDDDPAATHTVYPMLDVTITDAQGHSHEEHYTEEGSTCRYTIRVRVNMGALSNIDIHGETKTLANGTTFACMVDGKETASSSSSSYTPTFNVTVTEAG